jgi:hypothetical protein
MSRDYYNRRVGKDGERPRLTLLDASSQLGAAWSFVEQQGYLQRAFGYHCVDQGDVAGVDGSDVRQVIYISTGIKIATSVADFIRGADEVGMFTLTEFVHDHVAKPSDGAGRFHSFSNCGWHYDCRGDRFDEAAARREWRDKVNTFLKFYETGYELSMRGEIVRIAPSGMDELVHTKTAAAVRDPDRAKVENAVRTFHLGRSTREQRKQAVRDLVDVLEYHRADVKKNLSKDEGDLFNIANNFALRHHNASQRDDYDDAWLNWLFYVYLSTVHLVLGRVYGFVFSAADAAAQPPHGDASDDDEVRF